MHEFFNWFQCVILLGWACLGIGRATLMHRKGVNVLAPDPNRTRVEVLIDLVTGLCLLLEFWEVIAYSVPVPFHFGFGFLSPVVIDVLAVKVVGAIFLGVSVVLYGKALVDLGISWRLGIDRESPGGLVTHGIYAVCRHPIYLAFDLFFLGSFLVVGRLVFLVLPVVLVPMLHVHMLREERFLEKRYGESYRQYCAKVRRYLLC